MITVLHEQRETRWPDSAAAGEALWLDAQAVEQATGWHWKAEGLCHGETCVPVPPARRHTMVRGDQLDLAALWRHSGQPVLRDDSGPTWVLGTGAPQRAAALAAQRAPDFRLPDLTGQTHALSDYRGRKVLLATWASW